MEQPNKSTIYATTSLGVRAFRNVELVDEGEDSFVYQADSGKGRLYAETVPHPGVKELSLALVTAYEEEM